MWLYLYQNEVMLPGHALIRSMEELGAGVGMAGCYSLHVSGEQVGWR